jgi:VanZ family protein
VSTPRERWLGRAAWLACAAYLGLIWHLSSHAAEFEVLDEVPYRDKGVHFVEYGALTCMLVVALRQTAVAHPLRVALAAVWLTLCAGLSDELHQAFVLGRSGELPDLGADVLGAFAAALGFVAVTLVRGRARGHDARGP